MEYRPMPALYGFYGGVESEENMATNEELLRTYCASIIKIAVDIIQNEDGYITDNVDDLGKILKQLGEFKRNNYIVIPF